MLLLLLLLPWVFGRPLDDDDDDDDNAILRERAAISPYSAAVADESEETKYLHGQEDDEVVVLPEGELVADKEDDIMIKS